jgi:hypothetical protein
MDRIVRCVSCDGYGWTEDDFTGEAEDCEWCGRTGYVYEGDDGVQRPIPDADFEGVRAQLEALEQARLREMGYTGEAKYPWEQAVRKGTRGGLHPDERED